MTTGEREIEPTEAAIVQRIFREFTAGHSPKQIVKLLNREGIPGPFGGKWSPNTIHGNPKRGTGHSEQWALLAHEWLDWIDPREVYKYLRG